MTDTDQRVVSPPGHPMRVAREFLTDQHETEGHHTLRSHRGDFFRWAVTHWTEVADRGVRHSVYEWLEEAEYWDLSKKDPGSWRGSRRGSRSGTSSMPCTPSGTSTTRPTRPAGSPTRCSANNPVDPRPPLTTPPTLVVSSASRTACWTSPNGCCFRTASTTSRTTRSTSRTTRTHPNRSDGSPSWTNSGRTTRCRSRYCRRSSVTSSPAAPASRNSSSWSARRGLGRARSSGWSRACWVITTSPGRRCRA